MRTLTKFFTLLLCFELIVGPINPQLSLLGQEAFAQSCQKGMTWNGTLNRCVTTAEAARIMNATAQCASDDVECYKRNAQNAFQEKVSKGEAPNRKGDSFVSKVATIAAIAGPVTYVALGMSSSAAKCMSGSFYAMVGGAAALVIGDNYANLQHKKRLKKIKEDWGKIVNPEEANGDQDKIREANIESQSQAFEMLARAEDSLAEAAKLKHKFFLVATLAYTASAVMALMEKAESAAAETAAATAATTAVASNGAAAAVNPGSTATLTVAEAMAAAEADYKVTQEALETSAAQAAAMPPVGPAEAASATKSTSATGIALKQKAEAATIVAKATAMVTSAKAALASANAMPPAVSGPAIAAATKGLASATAALTAAKAQLAVANKNLCTSMGVTAYSPQARPASLYSYYIQGTQPDIRAEIQLQYNLANSQDLTSFVMNKRQLDGELSSSPLDEYAEVKLAMKDLEPQDKGVLDIFKGVSLGVLGAMNPIPSAHANEEVNTNAAGAYKEDKGKGIDFLSIGLGVGIGYLLVIKTSLREKLLTPTGRAVFSGVMGVMTLIMAQHAKSQAEASEKRAKLLREMKQEFITASGAVYACKSEDRNDPGKPNCFCYTPENKRNPNRGNSPTCQRLWAGKDTTATNYLSKDGNSKVCITKDRKPDPTCACKQTKSCMKVQVNGISGINPGTFSMMSSSLQPLNDIAGGVTSAASIDTAKLENQVARMKKLNEAVSKKIPIPGRKKAEDKLMKELQKASQSLPSSALVGNTSSSGMPSSPKEAAKLLEEELNKKDTPVTPLPTFDNTIAAPAAPQPDLEFGLSEDEAAMQEGQIAEVMQQDLDYGGNDINQGSTANIFEVLSSRYQRSGMRRLFDEKGTTQADKPAESDITQ